MQKFVKSGKHSLEIKGNMADTNSEIIAIGTEILLGEITDTNSVYIARALRDIGINLYFMTSVGDNEARIADAVRLALSRAQVVITCGGLGPTVDDMTRQAVAAATDRGLTFHQSLLDAIAQRFEGFRTKMTENNRRQAYVPDDAIIIENAVGTAPAFIVEHGDRVVISLPGVPREMKFLLHEHVIPYLRAKYQLGGKIIKARVLKTAGIGESALDELIGTDLLQADNPTVGLAAHSGQVDVRITAKADDVERADQLIAAVEQQLRERIGEHIFGADSDTIEQALVDALKAHGGTIALVEAGVEPVLSARLLEAAGTSDVVRSRDIFGDLAELAAQLGEPADQPLRQLAEIAAESAVARSNANVGVAVVAHSDVGKDQADKDALSAVAVSVNGKTVSRAYGFGGSTDTARVWTGTWAMSNAWRMLMESTDDR
jgi:nicotinamide-nucleotide amidase